MGRRKEFEVSNGTIKHIPTGVIAYFMPKNDEGQIKGYFTDDLFMGTSIKEVKRFFRQAYGELKK